MKNSGLKIKLQRTQKTLDISPTDGNYDFFCSVGQAVFNLHKDVLGVSEFFQEKIDNGDEICVLRQTPEIKCLSKILHILYGAEETICRRGQIDDVMEVVTMLRIRPLEALLKNDFMENFEEYPLFTLLKMANIYGYGELKSMCLQNLKEENYEQMNYERYQFFQLSHEMFIEVLTSHQQRKIQGSIQGFSDPEIKEIAREYDDHNRTKTNVHEIIQNTIIEMDLIPELQSNEVLFRSQIFLRKKIVVEEEQNMAKTEEVANQNIQKVLNDPEFCPEDSTFQEKKIVLNQLKEVNLKISEESEKMINDLNGFSKSIDGTKTSSQSPNDFESQLQEQLKELQQISLKGTSKLSELQTKMSHFLRRSSLNIPKNSSLLKHPRSTPASCQNSDEDRGRRSCEQSRVPSPPHLQKLEDWNTSCS